MNKEKKLKGKISLPTQSNGEYSKKLIIPKVTLTEEEKKQFEELKKFMSPAKNVLQWNNLRRIAKKIYPMKLISCLDGSGYMNTSLK